MLLQITLALQVVIGGFLFLIMFSEYRGKPFNIRLALQHQAILFIVLFVFALFSSGDDSNVEWVESTHGGQWVEMD